MLPRIMNVAGTPPQHSPIFGTVAALTRWCGLVLRHVSRTSSGSHPVGKLRAMIGLRCRRSSIFGHGHAHRIELLAEFPGSRKNSRKIRLFSHGFPGSGRGWASAPGRASTDTPPRWP